MLNGSSGALHLIDVTVPTAEEDGFGRGRYTRHGKPPTEMLMLASDCIKFETFTVKTKPPEPGFSAPDPGVTLRIFEPTNSNVDAANDVPITSGMSSMTKIMLATSAASTAGVRDEIIIDCDPSEDAEIDKIVAGTE